MNRHFTKDLQTGDGYIKWYLTSFLTREYKLSHNPQIPCPHQYG